ncbi:MAG: hypothetical protein CL583_18895 [Alteromonadaceae bacterium]|nr:hypothetical protein [Alteromonadaceae bacterium]|tara:strand:- start:1162 stop:2226 length:1065 start_codon:yes stop_codon:yes gene_type:complete
MDFSAQSSGYIQKFDTILYRVRPADSLSKILKHYHPQADDAKLQVLISEVVSSNPTIKDPDQIYPSQLIRIKVPEQYCSAPAPFHPLLTVRTGSDDWFKELEQDWRQSTPEERTFKSILLPALIGAGTAKATMIDTTFTTNRPLLKEMVENYESFKASGKTKGQYDYKRKNLVEKLARNLGPTSLLLNGTKAPTEVLRISRTKGITPTEPIAKQVRQMKHAAQIAKAGGVALSVIGLGIACSEIADAGTRNEKNEILVEASGSVAAGVLYGVGAGVAIALVATPVGWIAALMIGIGGAATGYLGGAIAKGLYSASGTRIDFAEISGVDAVCTARTNAPRRQINSVFSNNVIMSR